MKEYIVSADVLQNILNYLSERPYKDVFQLIQALQSSIKPVPENAPQPAPGDAKVE